MPAGIFGLKKTYKKQVLDDWPELAEFGYFGGGNVPGPTDLSTIDRLDFSNETVSAPGNNLTVARQDLAAVSNSNYGYFAGGGTPPTVCTIDRLDFSNETVAAPGITPGQLTDARSGLAGVSNSNYGYFGGGASVCTIDRLDFSNETVSAPGNDLTQARNRLAAVSNSNYGYFGGGFAPTPYVSTIDRLDFSNETVAAPGNDLTQARGYLAAVSNSNYGYFAGGFAPPGSCTIDRLDFSNETVLKLDDGITGVFQYRYSHAGVSNSNYGYFGGEFFNSNTNIFRLDFSNETTNIPPGGITQGRRDLAGVSTKSTTETIRKLRRGEFDASGIVYSNYGYFGGGEAAGKVSTIDRLDFSSETIQFPVTVGKLTQEKNNLAAVSNSNYGYFGGGSDPGPISSIIDRLDFSNETVDVPGTLGQLTEARYYLAAVSNSNYGYFGGGTDTFLDNYCTIDRLDFSTETVTGPPVHGINLTQNRNQLAGVSNSNYGYFGGGNTGANRYCTIDRLDFSSETLDVPGTLNQLTQARSALAAVSNSNYGYFAGGINPPSTPTTVNTIDRLDFSNETTSAPGNNLTQARDFLAAVSNSNYGYFGGGENPPSTPTTVCTIDRLDFSTETVDVPGTLGQLTEAKSNLAGTNIPLNQTRHVAPQAVVGVSTFFFSYGKPENTVSYGFGYFAGGSTSCTIDRLDFSTETVNGPSVHGMNLTQGRNLLAAVSNSNYGYFGGGENPPTTQVSTIDRLDFSSETVTGPPVHGMNLTQERRALAAVSSPRGYGYFAGGEAPPIPFNVCTIDRLDFSNETVDVPGTLEQLTEARYGLAAVSNSNYGYFGGGFVPISCTIDRLDFYNETILNPTAPLGQLTQAREGLAAVSNSNYGYFAGGEAPGNRFSTIDRLDFSSETVDVPTGYYLTQARSNLAAVSNSNYGYFGGGNTPGPTVVSTIERLDFSSETVDVPTGYYLTQSRSELAGTQVNYYQKVGQPISKAYGYFAGGQAPGNVNTIDRLDFSSETVSAPGNNLTQERIAMGAVSSPRGYGYLAGGFDPPWVCTIDRLDFSNETVAAPGAYQLTQARSGLPALFNSNYGYFAGGTPSPNDLIDRLDFSNETVSAPGNNLTRNRARSGAVSSSNYGYLAGGPGITCTIDRLDFSNETVDVPGTLEQLTQARGELAAVSNSNYGYFGGGEGPPGSTLVSTIDRLDFSNETVSAPGNNLIQEKERLAGVSNSNYGYFGGGYFPGPNYYSTIDRLDFTNETVAAPGNNLTQARKDLKGISN